MLIDEKGKLFGKISVIDLLVILVFVAAIAGCCYKFLGHNDTVNLSANDRFTTVMRVDGVKSFLPDAVKEGEAVYEERGGKIGVITDISEKPYQAIVPDKDNEFLTYENRYTVYLTLECTGRVNDKGFFSEGNSQIYTGSNIRIQSRLFTCDAIVDKVNP